ncbi:GNAT family N-acetyltransferase [Halomonas profundus]|nr:GNAT family N-acetyltransferase [Halomonas profundus]
MDVVHVNPEDARTVAEIHIEAWRAAYRSIVPADYLDSLSIERRAAMWDECIAAGDPELLVAKKAGVVQGWLSFGQCRDIGSHKSEAEVWAIYVSPTAWSTGVGRVLWLRAKELMLEQGFKSCTLWVFPQNERAIKFYRSVGFAHDGAAPKNFELGGVQLEEVRFVTQLLGGLITKDKRR